MKRRELIVMGLCAYWAGTLGWVLYPHAQKAPAGTVVIYVAPRESWADVASSLQKVHLLSSRQSFLATVKGTPRTGAVVVHGRPGTEALGKLFSAGTG